MACSTTYKLYFRGYKGMTSKIHRNTGLLWGQLNAGTKITDKRRLHNTHILVNKKVSQSLTSPRTFASQFGLDHSSAVPKSSIVQVDCDGGSCSLTWDDGLHARFHSVWLRHNCHCEQCRHPNGQRLLNSARVPHTIQLDTVSVNGDEVELNWKADEGHRGFIPVKYLRQHNYNDETITSFRNAVKMDTATKEIPFIEYEGIRNSKQEYLRWLKQINESGLSVVKNVPLKEGMVRQVGELIAPVWDSIYGVIFDVRSVPRPINVAYSNVHLDYHMDLVYFESPPGLQLLHCLSFDEVVDGGHSTFLDVFTVAEEFRKSHPEHFHTLATVPATFQKVHYDRDYPVDIVNQKPHIKLNHHGDIVAVYWAPTFEGPLSVDAKDVGLYYAAYELFAKALELSTHQLMYKMSPGDLVVFNNIRMLH